MRPDHEVFEVGMMPAGLCKAPLLCFCPLQTSFRWSVCGASQTDPASARLLPCRGFCSSRRFTNAFPALPNSLLKVILNKSLSLPSSLSQRLLDRKIKRLPPPLIVIGSYSFGAFGLSGTKGFLALIFFVAADI